MSFGLSPKFPLSISEQGDFTNNQDVKSLVKQNLKNLLLTNPGERIMIPDFGVGILSYLFETRGIGTIEQISAAINNQVIKYLPYISILDVNINDAAESENILSIKIEYLIKPLSITDSIEVIAQ